MEMSTTDTSLLTRYGYHDATRGYYLLRYRRWDDGDLYVTSGSYILGKRVGSDYYLAGSIQYRPVSRAYWLRALREWPRSFA